MKLADAQNLAMGLEIIDGLMASVQKWTGLTAKAVAEGRDLTNDELLAFRKMAEDSDAAVTAAIEARRKREGAKEMKHG